MKKTALIGTLLLSTAAMGQFSQTNPEGNVISFQTKNKDFSEIEASGTPYLEEDFQYGQIYFNDKVKYSGELRYNAYASEIEILQSNDEYSAALKRNSISAVIGDKKYQLFAFIDNNKGKRIGYFNPLNVGRIQLLFKPEIKLRKGRIPNTSYGRLVPPTYIDVSSYYLKIDDEPASKIYLKKKYLYKALGKNRVQSIMESKKLNLNKVDDVIILLESFNQKEISK
nr:hypothetical protein [Allomuricauda sp.]